MAFDYSKYNYDELVAEFSRLVAEKGTWKDAYQSSTGQVLIQLVAAITDQLHYMLERRTQENYLPSAQLPTSINAITALLGYRPKRKVSASGSLALTLTDINGTPIQNTDTITIPKYSAITFDKKNFTNVDDITLLSTQNYPFALTVKEGIVEELTFDASDINSTLFQSNYVTIADYIDIEDTSFFITTPTQTFVDVRERVGETAPIGTLGFAQSDDKVFDVVIVNEGLRIVFGDGINGEKPVGTVSVKFIRSSGSTVEVVTTANEFSFTDYETVLTDDSLNTYYYTLTNSTTIVGGEEEETIDHIKTYAPNYVSTANRAATKDDYKYWVKESGIGNIVDSNVYGEEELGVTVINANNVYITYLTNDGYPLTSTELAALDAYIDAYKIVTAQTIYYTATTIPLQVNLKLKRSSGLTASNSEVYDYVKDTITDYLAYQDGSLGKELNHSDVVDLLHNLTMTRNGVDWSVADYVTVDIRALYAFETPWTSVEDLDVTVTAGNTSDVYTININCIPYSYVQQAGDTATDIVQELIKRINLDLSVNAVVGAETWILTTSRQTRALYNELLYSEEFNNAAWSQTGNLTITGDADTAPNGLTVAQTIEDTDVAVASYIEQTMAIDADSDKRTISMFIKKDADTSRFPALQLSLTGGTGVNSLITFNTQTGDTDIPAGFSTPEVQVDDLFDWWRVSMTIQNDASNTSLTYRFYPAYTSGLLANPENPTETGVVTVWGAQFDDKATISNYVRTRAKPMAYDFEDYPVENRNVWGEDLSQTEWVKTGVSVLVDQDTDSDGYTTIDQLTFTGTGVENIYQEVSNLQANTTYTTSFYVKAGTLSTAAFGVWDVTNASWIVNPDDVTSIYNMDGTLKKVQVTFTTTASCSSVRVFVAQQNNSAGTMLLGQVQTKKSTNSATYIPSYEKPVFFYDEGFGISNENTTTTDNASIFTPIQLPLPLLQNTENLDLFLKGAVEIIQEDGTLLYTDDGAGSIAGGSVNYATGVVSIPILNAGKYYVRYLHNADENFDVTPKQAFTYSTPKADYFDTTELLSTIEIQA